MLCAAGAKRLMDILSLGVGLHQCKKNLLNINNKNIHIYRVGDSVIWIVTCTLSMWFLYLFGKTAILQ